MRNMVRLEQITAIFLAAGLAIPSYWFFWTLAGGGGYHQRETNQSTEVKINKSPTKDNLKTSSGFD